MTKPHAIALLLCAAAGFATPSAVSAGGDAEHPGWVERDAEGLSHVYELIPGVWSGSAPETELAYLALEEMGVKTVLSVDGLAPDAERLRAGDMRAVHIPLRYSGIDADERLALAKAVRDLPRPLYIHCQHGLHRSPTAAAVALIGAGELGNATGSAFQTEVGTNTEFTGLYEAVETAEQVAPADLDALVVEFVPARAVAGLREAMAQIDKSWFALDAMRRNEWDQAAGEAAIMHDAFRQAQATEEAASHDEGFDEMLAKAIVDSLALEEAVVAGQKAAADGAFTLVSHSCMECHSAYAK